MRNILLVGLYCLVSFVAIAKDEICPADTPMRKPFYSLWGAQDYECLSCDSKYLSIPKDECNKCADKRVFENGYCFFKKSIDKALPLFDIGYYITDGGGYVASVVGCGSIKPVSTSRSNCEECPNREYIDGKCVLKDRKQMVKKEDVRGDEAPKQRTTQTPSTPKRPIGKWNSGGPLQ